MNVSDTPNMSSSIITKIVISFKQDEPFTYQQFMYKIISNKAK